MTTDQHIAANPAISAWVAASAGTGKTKVLTDRVLRLLLSGARPGHILCITYTKAAAAEMRTRIEGQLGRWAIAADTALKDSLTTLTGTPPDKKILKRARQLFAIVLDAPEQMRIQTIHGFCQSVLTRFPLEAGVQPHFTVIDEYSANELLKEARMLLFSAAPEEAVSRAITALAELLDETRFGELVGDIVNARQKFASLFAETPGIPKLHSRLHALLGVAEGVMQEDILRECFQYSPEQKASLKQALQTLAYGTKATDMKTHTALGEWLERHDNPKQYIRTFLTQQDELKEQKSIFTKDMLEHWPPLKDVLLAEQQRAQKYLGRIKSFHMSRVSTCVLTLAEALLGIYQHLKAQHNYMDYDDLVFHAVNLLTREDAASWVLFKLDGGIDHLLVDEAQDTSPEQWKLVNVLADEFFAGEGARNASRTLFVVGDEKQSILSFQGANPEVFGSMQQHFSRRMARAPEAFKRVRLALSFRSTEPVLKAVDLVFSQAAARDGLIFSENDITHGIRRTGVAGRVELWPLEQAQKQESDPSWSIATDARTRVSAEQRTAQKIADTIDSWLKSKRPLTSCGRAVTPGDILILVQRRGSFFNTMLSALKRKNIPVAGADRLMLTEHIAIMDCLKLAEFLLLPQDDLTLAVVLKSPFIGLTEEALFELAYARGKEHLWQRLKANAKYAAATELLSDLLAKADYLTPYDLFAYLLESRGGRKKLVARLGHEIEDPLNEFLSLALGYERLHTPSLQGFLHWLTSGATAIKRDMEQSADEVRIMTVHGAKGLEAPIVFLPDTVHTPPSDDRLLWTHSGIPLWSPFAAYNDTHYQALRDEKRLDAMREYRRLLYVAMTRTEDELYVTGWTSNRQPSPECWYELIRQGIEGKEEWVQEHNNWVLHSPQTEKVPVQAGTTKEHISTPLPAWTNKPAAHEPTPPKPLTPSRPQGVEKALSPLGEQIARERGALIHRLLQYLPDVAAPHRHEAALRLAKRHGGSFSAKDLEVLIREALAVLNHPEFAAAFGPDSVAEAPVAGKVLLEDGTIAVISGQIDRLAVCEKDVFIIDYKTNRDIPANERLVPDSYLQQMEAYRKLIAEIYPEKTVHCALLWTVGPTLMTLSPALLAGKAA